jgi:hypothetical protein
MKEMTMRSTLLITFALAACTGTVDGGDDGGDDGPDPVVCEPTRTYLGFGGLPLEQARPAIEAGTDRLRMKPFTALATEYERALGLATFDTKAYAATFGRPPARWYAEPLASANTVYAAFALAYDACTQHTAQAPLYANAPDATSAGLTCREIARKAWHREATDAEAAACVTYTVDQTLPGDPARKRWSYSCAAVLSASGFLAY